MVTTSQIDPRFRFDGNLIFDDVDALIDGVLDELLYEDRFEALEDDIDKFLNASEVSRAIRLNPQYARSLGWLADIDHISRLLGLNQIPTITSAELADAVAYWQLEQELEPDGIIGPNTWIRMQQLLRQRPSIEHSAEQVSLPSSTWSALTYGVPGGVLLDPFYRTLDEKFSRKGSRRGRAKHLGIDVTARRGSPVYATLKPEISIDILNRNGLEIRGQGMAILQFARVFTWGISWSKQPGGYGGAVTLACVYSYRRLDGLQAYFTLSIEYLHLITQDYPPRDDLGRQLATSSGVTFGPRMRHGAILQGDELTGRSPLLVGYLGATQTPHVHIQASYRAGEAQTRPRKTDIRLDPTVMLY